MTKKNKQTVVSTGQMRAIEKKSVEYYGIPEIIMMENAGRAVAETACVLAKKSHASRIIIVCGTGNNGGDGLVAARHLHNRGLSTAVVLSRHKEAYRGLAAQHLSIIEKMGLKIYDLKQFHSILSDDIILIDALFGTGIKGEITGESRQIVETINNAHAPVLSVDIPSGLDADTGSLLGCAVQADETITMAAVKTGMCAPSAGKYTGIIHVADIGIPKELIYMSNLDSIYLR